MTAWSTRILAGLTDCPVFACTQVTAIFDEPACPAVDGHTSKMGSGHSCSGSRSRSAVER